MGVLSIPRVAGQRGHLSGSRAGSAAQTGQKSHSVGIGWTARSCGHCDARISGNQINCREGAVPTHPQSWRFCREASRAGSGYPLPNIDMASAGPLLCGGIACPKTATDAPYYCYQPRWRHRYWRVWAYRHKAVKHAMAASPRSAWEIHRKSRKCWRWGHNVVNSRDPKR